MKNRESVLLYGLKQAMLFDSQSDGTQLEKHFTLCDRLETLAEFVEDLINTPLWASKRCHGGNLPEACQKLAASIDAYVGSKAEPAYHSRRHFKEVCLSLSFLLQSGQSLAVMNPDASVWSVNDQNCWILLLAAIAHDFGHEGRPNRRHGELEEKACALAEEVLGTSLSLPVGCLQTIKTLILSTEPSLYNDLIKLADNAGERICTEDVMKVLLVEADLLASMLPNYGVVLGKLLAEEYRTEAPALASLIDSAEGRQGFLKAHPSISPNLRYLGFND
jgi:hypothetical protein